MSLWRKLITCTLVAAMTGSPLFAEGPIVLQTGDIVLQDGVMRGTIVDPASHPIAGQPVRLYYQDTQIAEAVSNSRGEFSISGLRNGSHTLACGSNRNHLRFWGADAAPPAASQRAMIVVGHQIVRAQDECVDGDCGEGGLWGSRLGRPAMLLAIAGGAVGIIAIIDHNNDDGPVSP